MKIDHRNKQTRNLLAATAIVALIAVASGVFAWQVGYFDSSSDDTRPKTTDVTDENYQQSAEEVNTEDDNDPKSDLPAKSQSSPSPQKAEPARSDDLKTDSSITAPSIERAGQSGDNIKVVAGFASAQSGICQATFTRQGQPTLSYKSNITVSPSNYSCVFVVPASAFTVNGSWELSLVNRINERISNASTANIEVSR